MSWKLCLRRTAKRKKRGENKHAESLFKPHTDGSPSCAGPGWAERCAFASAGSQGASFLLLLLFHSYFPSSSSSHPLPHPSSFCCSWIFQAVSMRIRLWWLCLAELLRCALYLFLSTLELSSRSLALFLCLHLLSLCLQSSLSVFNLPSLCLLLSL